jgi:hypothetical protein
MDIDFIFQQDGAPPHFIHEVTSYISRTVVAWIGHCGTIAWPPQSPDLTPLDCTVWGYVKDRIFIPTLLASLAEVRA